MPDDKLILMESYFKTFLFFVLPQFPVPFLSRARDIQAALPDIARHLWIRLEWSGGPCCHYRGTILMVFLQTSALNTNLRGNKLMRSVAFQQVGVIFWKLGFIKKVSRNFKLPYMQTRVVPILPAGICQMSCPSVFVCLFWILRVHDSWISHMCLTYYKVWLLLF